VARVKFFRAGNGGELYIVNPTAMSLSLGLAIETDNKGDMLKVFFPSTFLIDILQYLNITPFQLEEMYMNDLLFWAKLVAEKKREDMLEEYQNKWGVLISSVINSGYNIVRAWGAKIHTSISPDDIYPFIKDLRFSEDERKKLEQRTVESAVELGIPAPKVK